MVEGPRRKITGLQQAPQRRSASPFTGLTSTGSIYGRPNQVGVIDVHDEAFVKRSVSTRGVDRAISC